MRIYSVYGLVEAFHGQVRRGSAFEDLVHEEGSAPEHLSMARARGDERQSFQGLSDSLSDGKVSHCTPGRLALRRMPASSYPGAPDHKSNHVVKL